MTSRRPPVERSNGNAERTSVLSGEIGTQLRDASLDAPHLDARCPELVGELLPAQLLGLSDLFDPLGDRRDVLGSHATVVSETETPVESFQTQKRKTAITLEQMEPPPFLTMEHCEGWADQLEKAGVKEAAWSKVLDRAGLADPDKARATRSRMRKGEARPSRIKLYDVLMEIQRKHAVRTKFGDAMANLQRWNEIGSELFKLAPGALADLVHRAEVVLEANKHDDKNTDPFGNLK